MGYRTADPPSPASHWLRRLDQKEHGNGHAEKSAMDVEYESRSAAVSPKTVVTPHRHGVDCEMLAQSAEPATIEQAIELASPRALRKLLRMMVYSQQASMDLASAYLMPARPAPQTGSMASKQTARKRKMYETCQHCRSEFEPGNNHEERCSYHPGQQTMIPYGFAYAQSGDSMYQWTCCNQVAGAVGCVWQGPTLCSEWPKPTAVGALIDYGGCDSLRIRAHLAQIKGRPAIATGPRNVTPEDRSPCNTASLDPEFNGTGTSQRHAAELQPTIEYSQTMRATTSEKLIRRDVEP